MRKLILTSLVILASAVTTNACDTVGTATVRQRTVERQGLFHRFRVRTTTTAVAPTVVALPVVKTTTSSTTTTTRVEKVTPAPVEIKP